LRTRAGAARQPGTAQPAGGAAASAAHWKHTTTLAEHKLRGNNIFYVQSHSHNLCFTQLFVNFLSDLFE